MSNRLARETSPYLLQHRNNPVDWYPWGPEALARARDEDRPIFLSIGYSACHWCHVMEHESFENAQIAALMNAHFVCIKVDREERPDLDHIYMQAVQIMTGRGGWPMSMFLTPDLRPFYGGTYWPPQARMGMPGFGQVLQSVAQAWEQKRDQLVTQAGELTKYLQVVETPAVSDSGLNGDLLHSAAVKLEQAFDFTHGGFGSAPKFPHSMNLELLLRVWRRQPRPGFLEMVKLNLDKMAHGGIYDHLAGGFARYSVDARWLVPHFEKMLYDNALLAGVYLEGYLVTRDPEYARVTRETLDYVLNYMTDAEGGFHSAEDADSEGAEGKFYVWSAQEIRQVLGPDRAARFCYVYDVTDEGNFEGHNILHLPKTVSQCAALRGWDPQELAAELASSRARLLEVRDRRVRPGKDDKVLVSWNGLMIDSLARAAAVFGEARYRDTAIRAADFILHAMRRSDGRLWHTWRLGQARLDAYLDDYACLINALVSVYEATFQERWIDAAIGLAERLLRHFFDPAEGGFYFTADDHEQLIARQKDLQDASVPSGNAMGAMALLRLGRLTGRQDFWAAAEKTLLMTSGLMEQSPLAAGQMLLATDFYLGPCPEIAILADVEQVEPANLVASLFQHFLPNRVVACRNPAAPAPTSGALDALFEGKQPAGSLPTVFVCENFACQAPVSGRAAILETWERLARVE